MNAALWNCSVSWENLEFASAGFPLLLNSLQPIRCGDQGLLEHQGKPESSVLERRQEQRRPRIRKPDSYSRRRRRDRARPATRELAESVRMGRWRQCGLEPGAGVCTSDKEGLAVLWIHLCRGPAIRSESRVRHSVSRSSLYRIRQYSRLGGSDSALKRCLLYTSPSPRDS